MLRSRPGATVLPGPADASLLAEHRPGRYVMHDLVRGYAAGQAQQAAGEAGIRAAIGRSLDHYLHTMASFSYDFPPLFTPAPPATGVVAEQIADEAGLLDWARAVLAAANASVSDFTGAIHGACRPRAARQGHRECRDRTRAPPGRSQALPPSSERTDCVPCQDTLVMSNGSGGLARQLRLQSGAAFVRPALFAALGSLGRV